MPLELFQILLHIHTLITLCFLLIESTISITADKRGYHGYIFCYFSMKTCCGKSLEVPQWGTSNEYPQYMFSWRIKKNVNTFWLKKRAILSYDIQLFYKPTAKTLIRLHKCTYWFGYLYMKTFCKIHVISEQSPKHEFKFKQMTVS